MHKALYRKWRPQVFEDVIGQDYIVTVLKNQIATGKVGHAYLFTGTRGTGKTTCAKIFSKAVNCENIQGGDPCLECSNCKSISNGSAIDVVEIDAASNTGVDNIRDIIEESVYSPVSCKYRVYIIDEVHMLSTSAFNALLKIMEEPPSHVIFILATTEVHQVPVTIISRCQRYDFQRIGDDLIVSQLLKVANGEGINLDSDAAAVIARLADGGMRDALSLFDQCASFDNNVTRDVVAKVSGQADRSFIFEMAKAISNEDTALALNLTHKAHTSSLSFSFITAELISLFRDAMILKSVGNKNEELFPAATDFDELKAFSDNFNLAQIMFCLNTLSDTLNSLGKSAYPNVVFESCIIKLCSPFLSDDKDAILSRIEKLEKRLTSVPSDFSPFSAPIKKEEKPIAPVVKKPVLEEERPPVLNTTSEINNTGKAPFKEWDKVLNILSSENPPLLGVLRQSRAFIEGDVVYIDTNDFSFTVLKSSEANRQSLKAAVLSASGKPYKIAQYKEKNSSPQNSSAMAEILKRAERNGVDIHKD